MAASDTEALLRSNRLSPSFVRKFGAIEWALRTVVPAAAAD